ncbi:hypothetical protein GCM10010260_57500 [Streptomyces filipinensis]|uniref:Uncharacterized protein n=1 Tax=Streptomyces filipinensis TaxID=66887 RepID=A0A918IGK5_9ACTN|nr:hypothetical protein [Streptomyces filipinensis]GGV11330.1 hypothetical protein GCM10010260_57500 [Streptomyces filipinensis]
MVALRLTRSARPAVQLRRLLVAAASAGTGFLLLSCLGYALNHPGSASAAALRLAWCTVPLAATGYLALAVARTDPGARPRPGLSAVGLGPARLMAVSALTTALSCSLGSLLALLVFLHLRGDLTGMPFDGAAADVLAAGRHLPGPATLTLLALPPAVASAAVALALRPKDPGPATPAHRTYGRFGAFGHSVARETFGTCARFGARLARRPTPADEPTSLGRSEGLRQSAGGRTAGAAPVGADGTPSAPGSATGIQPPGTPAPAGATGLQPPSAPAPGSATGPTPPPPGSAGTPAPDADWSDLTAKPPREAPAGLPWGIALLASGLTAQAYADRSSLGVLAGWLLTTTGLVLAAPGLTHVCGWLLQSTRPGALRLLAGRVLMTEATRIGRPLGVVCAVASAGFAMTTLYTGSAPAFGPLTTFGTLLVAGCTVATLVTAAVETRQCRAGTTAALLRLGAPATLLRMAVAIRAAALLAFFGPLTLGVAALAALPVTR